MTAAATSTVEAAYRRCEDITRSRAANFAYGIRLLPPAKRRALSAIYATARRIDDIGDGGLRPTRSSTGSPRPARRCTGCRPMGAGTRCSRRSGTRRPGCRSRWPPLTS